MCAGKPTKEVAKGSLAHTTLHTTTCCVAGRCWTVLWQMLKQIYCLTRQTCSVLSAVPAQRVLLAALFEDNVYLPSCFICTINMYQPKKERLVNRCLLTEVARLFG